VAAGSPAPKHAAQHAAKPKMAPNRLMESRPLA
jgi:hypothetical protein